MPAPDRAALPELTLRGIALGCVITLAFTAANLYLGLKIGLTFATSIPAAVISMALLKAFRSSNIYENNIVQTVASAAGTLSSIGFVLPGLIMTGWWTGFDFWTTFWVCAIGGLLGVLFSVPLRRALVTGSDLPYPEGVAAAAVLQVGSQTSEGAAESKVGLRVIVISGIAAAAFQALAATQLAVGEVTRWFRIGPAGTGAGFALQFALIGAGHLVGITVGVAILTGIVIGFGIVTPLMTMMQGAPDAAAAIWRHDVRFFGAGVIGIAAIWTLLKLIGPILSGLSQSLAAARHRRSGGALLPIEERDLPIGLLGIGLAFLILPTAWLLVRFLEGGPLAPLVAPLAALGVIYVVIAGAIVAAICGYMAGLIGASNSPVSGVGILGIVGAGLLLAIFVKPHVPDNANAHLVALAIFLTSLIFSAATISNDNLQDLKTGQLVGATPWKQQVALMIGVIAGSLVIPFTLDLLNQAYGFAPLEGAPPPQALGAPQATLISSLAKGVLGAGLDWAVIGAGVAVGAVLIVIDEGLRRATPNLALPPLAVGLGIYLPMSVMLPTVVGALIGWAYERRVTGEAGRRTGVLLASGLIVGDGLFGVLLAGLIVATGSGAPLALVGPEFESPALVIGAIVFTLAVAGLYRWTARLSARLP